MLSSFSLCHAKGRGGGTELYLNLNLLCLKLNQPSPAEAGAGQQPLCAGALQTGCHLAGNSVHLSWLPRTLGFYFCLGNQLALTPHSPGTLNK